MIGLPHQPAANDGEPSAHSSVAMDGREGRIGNSFACERCRKHKVRCVPSETAGICQRCQKARVECIEHVARRRPAKPRTMVQTPTRVSEMEKKLDKLSAVITATNGPNSAPQPTLPPVTALPSQISEVTQSTPTPASIAPVPTLPSVTKAPILSNPSSTPEATHSFWEFMNDTISGLGRLDPVIRSISMIHIQLLLENYRTMADFFPFVNLPKDCSCRDLLQQRPMLVFSVLTVASHDSRLSQLTLSREFRKVAMVMVMNGEKSLDLLQGLLVFIAWHHHYMDPQAVSIHMLLQICIGITGELGLDNIPRVHPKETQQDREAKRAYLGCYYLSTNLGIFESSRVRSFTYSNTLRSYASDLVSAWEYGSDSLIPALIETCQLVEDVHETFRDRSEPALVARSQVKRLKDRWDSLRDTVRQVPTSFKTLDMAQFAARGFLYNCALSLEIVDRDNAPGASGFPLSMRIQCLRSIEEFLQNSVRLSTNQYECLSIIDWLNLVSILTTLGKLALHATPMPGWDPVDLQLSHIFEHFRDKLCNQMPRPRDNQEQNEDVFERFRRITSIMKMAVKNIPGRGSPNGSTFEITTSSRQAVSILQDLPPLKLNGTTNGVDSLPALWKVNPALDMSRNDFPWKFLMGKV